MASEDMIMMMMNEASLSYSSSSTSNESSSSLTSTSNDYLSSSTDSVKPTSHEISNLTETRLGSSFIWKHTQSYKRILCFAELTQEFFRR